MTELITIHAAGIHRINKKQHTTNGTTEINKIHSEIEYDKDKIFIDHALKKLKEGYNHSYSGGWDIDQTLSKVLKLNYLTNPSPNYEELIKNIFLALFNHLNKSSASTGGDVPIIFYKNVTEEFLLINILSLSEYQGIDNGVFTDQMSIDNKSFRIGILINLTEMKSHFTMTDTTTEIPSYIKWISKSSTENPTKYIQEFIPVANNINDQKSTNDLYTTINNFIDEELSSQCPIAGKEILAAVNNFLDKKSISESRSIHIENDIVPIITFVLSQHQITPVKSFQEYRNNANLQSEFNVHPSTVRKHSQYDLKISGIKIAGSKADLGNNTVIKKNNDNTATITTTMKETISMLDAEVIAKDLGITVNET
ncbi:nucleoid-associated protein [Wohlfahrtiimonas chitiniclastica]|uniref:nucleoid-associated protein n=1 Tax=Wohlfahrtiimonas chitiniclastica TaxID=400946 RepID=UPI001BCED5FC|nr:nucleoid-associated protein [Wohlfahrtiimonas chitiniclastica]MBS7819034.1 nucleoid-associated protein [Wohlfahrtiimonas chitiniclastica]